MSALRPALRAPRAQTWLALLVLGILAILVAAPLAGLVTTTLTVEGRVAWADVVTSPMSGNLLWQPLANTLLIGLGTGVLSTLLGGFLAWVVVLSDVPGRRLIGALATIPFAMPGFATALAWQSVFRNERLGGSPGLLSALGVTVPDSLAWGGLPIVLVLVSHYYSLSFIVVAAALAGVGGDLLAAAELTGASRLRVAARIVLPAVLPAVVSGFLLAFAEGVSNFAVPALLGLPVRFQTLSTRLYGAISTGQPERGYVLAILLVTISAVVLWAGTRATRSRSYETITGKSTRPRRVRTGAFRWPLAIGSLLLVGMTTIVPAGVLALSTLLRYPGRPAGGLTAHYWVGASDPSIAQGMRGVLRDSVIVDALGWTLLLGLLVALGATVLGVMGGVTTVRLRGLAPVKAGIAFLSYVPFLIPGIALGAAVIAQFGAPAGPFPGLYGTLAILVIGGIAASVPFAFQTARSSLGQIGRELEEAALLTGASGMRRFTRITLPLAVRGVVGGGMLVFVTMVRDLSLVVLLVTPATPLLSVLTYRYASEGFTQHANAITLVIAAVSVGVTILARRLQGGRHPGTQT